MRMEAVLPVALNVYHDSCQTVSPKKKYIWNLIYIIYYYYIFVLFTIFLFLSQWFCIRNTVMLLSTERFRDSRGQSQELMKKEGTLCPLATSPHPAHSAHHEAPPFPFGRTFLMFDPVDNSTTLAMKSVNCRRWLHIQKVCFDLFFINQQILLKKKQLILSWLVFSFQAKFELVTSEASYIRSLSIAVDHFMTSPELCECLGMQERQWLFSKLPDVKEVSERWIKMKSKYNFCYFWKSEPSAERCFSLSPFQFSLCP